ncbi:MAG TPA: HlyD family type I secretion periplasmic adaptor subunit [Gammaproteobacteria bacterium]
MRADRRFTEFLPAALELQRAPPSPLGRALLWSIAGLLVGAVAWAGWARIDIVASAPGRVIPSGQVKVVQSRDGGSVRRILVAEGQQVAAGELLVELDDTEAGVALRQVEHELAELGAERQRLERLLVGLEALDGGQPPPAPEGVALPEAQARLLREELDEVGARLAELDSEGLRRRAELAAAEAQHGRLLALLPLVTRRAEALQRLDRERLAATQAWLEIEQERVGLEQASKVEASRQAVLRAGLAALERARAVLLGERRRQVSAQLAESSRRLALLGQQRLQQLERLARTRLVAPVAGRVQQLALHTVGGVVTPAQALLRIVPSGAALEVEARVLNRDVGHVRAGMPAEVKVEAFPFTRYGTLPASLAELAADARLDEGLGAVYIARVLLQQLPGPDDGPLRVTPGMAVTVEIRTGERTLLELLLSPLLKALQEAGRER